LHRVEREIVREHLHVDAWIFVAGKADKTNFTLLLGLG
jgi:hypothetical protein